MRACSQSLEAQVVDLATLADGWMNGEGKAFSMTLIAQVSRVVTQLVELYTFTMPFLYPTVDGAVRAEWPGDRWEVVVWIREDGLEMTATENDGAGCVEGVYAAADMAGIAIIATEMAELLKEPG